MREILAGAAAAGVAHGGELGLGLIKTLLGLEELGLELGELRFVVLQEVVEADRVLAAGVGNELAFQVLEFGAGLAHLGVVKGLGLVGAAGRRSRFV